MFLHEDYSAGGLDVSAIAGLAFSGISEETVIERLREFAFSFFRDILAQSGKKIWVEKTAFDIFHMANIEKLCSGHCRFLCLVRHPMDVVCSVADLVNQLEVLMPELHRYVISYPNQLEAYAHAWVDASNSLIDLTRRNEESALLMRYEDLVDAPDSILSAVFDFLDLPLESEGFSKAALEKDGNVGYGDWKTYESNEVHQRSRDRWRNLSEESVSRIGALVNPIAQELGYEPVPVMHEADPENARRKFQFGCIISRMR